MNRDVRRGPFLNRAAPLPRDRQDLKQLHATLQKSPNPDLAFSPLRYFDVASFSAVFKQTITFIVDMIQS